MVKKYVWVLYVEMYEDVEAQKLAGVTLLDSYAGDEAGRVAVCKEAFMLIGHTAVNIGGNVKNNHANNKAAHEMRFWVDKPTATPHEIGLYPVYVAKLISHTPKPPAVKTNTFMQPG